MEEFKEHQHNVHLLSTVLNHFHLNSLQVPCQKSCLFIFILFISLFTSLSRQCLVLPIIFLSQFGFSVNPSHCNFIHPPVYQSLQTLSYLAYNLLQSIWIFGEICLTVISFISLFISLSRQCLVLLIIFFSQFGFLGKYVLLSSLISLFISIFRQCLVFPMIFFSQLGFSRKSVLF